MACRLPIPLTARILVLRALPGLGDLLCSVPMLRSLRSAYPMAHITWLGLPGTQWFCQRFPHLVDSWLPFPGFPGIPEGWQSSRATVQFLHTMHRQPYDLVLQLHGNGSSINPFLTLLGGRYQAGFYLPELYCPDARFFLPYPEGGSEVDRLLQLMGFLGLPQQTQELEFPVEDAEYRQGLQLLKAHSLEPGRYICVHPGASSEDRRWSAAGFAQVANRLAETGYRVVLTGTSGERALTQKVSVAMNPLGARPLNLAGRTSLGSLAVLLRYAALLVCNDTGISHLAAALKTPSVVVFSNSEVKRWSPSDGSRHRVVDSRIAADNTLDAVLAQTQSLLQTQAKPAKAMAEVCYVP